MMLWERFFLLRRLVLGCELVHFVFHVGEIGQLIIEMAIEQLDPEHQLPLLVPSDEVIEKLEAGDE